MREEHVGQDPLVALGKSGGGGNIYGPTTAWLAFGDLTAVLLINSMGGYLPGFDDVIKRADAMLDRQAVHLMANTVLRMAAQEAISRQV